MDEQRRNYEDLVQKYREHRQSFEKWTQDFSRQAGTPDYVAYVERFKNWEANVLLKIKEFENKQKDQLPAQRMEDDLLQKATVNQFFTAIAKMHEKNPAFIPAMLKANEALEGQSQPVKSSAVPIVPVAPYTSYSASTIATSFGANQPIPATKPNAGKVFAFQDSPQGPIRVQVITPDSLSKVKQAPTQYTGTENVDIF